VLKEGHSENVFHHVLLGCPLVLLLLCLRSRLKIGRAQILLTQGLTFSFHRSMFTHLLSLNVGSVPVMIPDLARVGVHAEHTIDFSIPFDVDRVVSVEGMRLNRKPCGSYSISRSEGWNPMLRIHPMEYGDREILQAATYGAKIIDELKVPKSYIE